MAELFEKLLGQIVLFTSLLCAFSFSVALQLLTQEKTTRIITSTAITFLVATITLLLATWLSITLYGMFLIGADFSGVYLKTLENGFLMIMFLGTVGTITFVAGIGLSGWMHSKAIGIVSTLISATALLFMVVFHFTLTAVPIR